MSDGVFLESYYKQKVLNLVNPIISVMSKHLYDSSTVLKVLLSDEGSKEDTNADEALEVEVNILGAKLLERLIDANELKRMIKNVKSMFNPLVQGYR
jgi:hypothetical protein